MNDTELPPHQIFRADGDQLEMLTAILDAFPGQAGNPDVVVPIHPRVRGEWAKVLIRRGVVVVPELMRELPMPTGDHPEAGWLQPMEWVGRAEYAERSAARAAAPSGSSAEQQVEQAKAMLRAVKPDLLDQIEALKDPEQRAAMAARLKAQIPAHVDAVAAALAQVERTKEENDDA